MKSLELKVISNFNLTHLGWPNGIDLKFGSSSSVGLGGLI